MVKRTYLKTVARTFKENIVRLCVIIALIAISTAIVTGLGALAPRLRRAAESLAEATPQRLGYIDFIADGIERISFVFPVFFVIVAALVVYMTVTRLVESERQQTGCLKTLGYSRLHIMAKYLCFVFTGCVAGCVIGIISGYYIVSPVLFAAVKNGLNVPNSGNIFPEIGLYAALFILFFTLAVTAFAAFRTAREKPANLFSGKAPKAGGKILLERIPFFWNVLKFKYKSTLRNIFRYKVRFFITVFSMLLSTALVFCGLALFFAMRQTNPDLNNTIQSISTIVVLAAVLLNTLVVYNITNINIEERKREIATLMVLGYRNIEVTGYVFREIFLLTVLGGLIGLPVGYGVMTFVFDYLRFGGIEHVKWYVWLITAVLALVSLALADLLLFRKLLKTDMHGSLKTNE